MCSSHRTSAMFLEPPKLAVPTAAAASLKRYTSQNPQGTSLPLDKVKVEVAAPVGAMAPQAAVASGSAVKSPQAGGKQGWDTVRRAFQTPHRGENITACCGHLGAWKTALFTVNPMHRKCYRPIIDCDILHNIPTNVIFLFM